MNARLLLNSLATAMVATLCSCGGNSELNNAVEHYPFKYQSGASKGLVSGDGKVLFEAGFNNDMTFGNHERFLAKDDNGLWTIYTSEEKPAQVGERKFKDATGFFADVIPAVEEGGYVQLVNTDGETVKMLDKLDGKTIISVGRFNGGIALVTDGFRFGAINTSGELIIKPTLDKIYPCNDEKIVGITYQDKKVHVFNTSGKEISTFDFSPFGQIDGVYQSGLMVAETNEEKGESSFGLIDEDGEWVLKPSQEFGRIIQIKGDYAIFIRNRSCGLMKTDGEILIAPNNNIMYFVDDEILASTTDKVNHYKLMDLKGESIATKTYKRIMEFNGEYAWGESDAGWTVIDKKGEPIDKTMGLYKIHMPDKAGGSASVVTQIYTLDDFLTNFMPAKDGSEMFKFGKTNVAYIDDIWKLNYYSFNAEDRLVKNVLSKHGDLYSTLVLGFDGPCVANRKPTEAKLSEMQISFSLKGQLEGKKDMVWNRLEKVVKDWGGKEAGSLTEPHIKCFKFGNDEMAAYIWEENDEIGLAWGKGSLCDNLIVKFGNVKADDYSEPE